MGNLPISARKDNMKKKIMVDGKEFEIEVRGEKNHFRVDVNGEAHYIDIAPTKFNGFSSILVDGYSLQVNCRRIKEGDYLLTIGHNVHEVMFREAMIEATMEEGEAIITSPMPGLVADVKVSPNDEVKQGQQLLILEAMKMFNEITAKADGKVAEVLVKKGDTVSIGQKLIVIESSA